VDLGALTSGALIGLREGVEAALIVAIVLSYLVRSGNGAQAGKVWLGTGAAAVASLAAGIVIFATIGSLQAPYEQYFEGGAMVLAAAVVTWMLFWIRRQSTALRGELHAAVDRALSAGSAWGLAALAFTAVIREGLETSVFLVGQATSTAAGAASVLVGALVGLVVAAGIGWVFYTGSRRVNLRVFFKWTGITLVLIAAGLLSKSVHELVEVGVIGFGTGTVYDISGILPQGDGVGQFLRAILGYSDAPELVTLITHVAYLGVVLALYLRPVRFTPPAVHVDAPQGAESARG
jgi:high-affinity iron transporter